MLVQVNKMIIFSVLDNQNINFKLFLNRQALTVFCNYLFCQIVKLFSLNIDFLFSVSYIETLTYPAWHILFEKLTLNLYLYVFEAFIKSGFMHFRSQNLDLWLQS